MTIETSRLRLRTWRDGDRDAFAALHADLQVMVDAVAPLDRAASDAKVARYAAAHDDVGYSRWCVESRAGEFLGYVGMMQSGTASRGSLRARRSRRRWPERARTE